LSEPELFSKSFRQHSHVRFHVKDARQVSAIQEAKIRREAGARRERPSQPGFGCLAPREPARGRGRVVMPDTLGAPEQRQPQGMRALPRLKIEEARRNGCDAEGGRKISRPNATMENE